MTATPELHHMRRYRTSYGVKDGRMVGETICSTMIVVFVGDRIQIVAERDDA